MALAPFVTVPGAIVMLMALFIETIADRKTPRRTSLRNGLAKLSPNDPVFQTPPLQEPSQPERGAALVQITQAPPTKTNGKNTKARPARRSPYSRPARPARVLGYWPHGTTLAQPFPGRLDNGTFENGDDTGVFISSKKQIPTVAPNARGELFYLEAAINVNERFGLDTGKISVYHSGIGVTFGTDRFAVQWYAKEGLGSAIFPSADGKWTNEAVLVLSPSIDPDYWTKRTKVGDITGAMWNKHAEFLVSYIEKHPAYQLWRVVWAGDVLIPDSVCDSFSEASLLKFQKLGAEITSEDHLLKFQNARPPLQRNYVTLGVKEKPTLVDMGDTTQADEALQFFKKVHASMESKVFTIVDFAASYVKGLFVKNNDRVGFVGSPLSGGVFRVVVEGQRGHSLKLDYADMAKLSSNKPVFQTPPRELSQPEHGADMVMA